MPAMLLAIAHCAFAAVLVEVGDHDRCALTRKADRGCASDSARGAGDDRNFVFESAHDARPLPGELRTIPHRDLVLWIAGSKRPAKAVWEDAFTQATQPSEISSV